MQDYQLEDEDGKDIRIIDDDDLNKDGSPDLSGKKDDQNSLMNYKPQVHQPSQDSEGQRPP